MDKVSSSGETPLTAAARAGKYDKVSFLSRGACVNGSNARTMQNRNKTYVEHEEIHCEDSEKNEDEYRRSYQGQNSSPLYCALKAGHVEVAKPLIERGADIHARQAGQAGLTLSAIT